MREWLSPSSSFSGVTVTVCAVLQSEVVKVNWLLFVPLPPLIVRPAALDAVIVTDAVGSAVSLIAYVAFEPSVTASDVMSAESAAFRKATPSATIVTASAKVADEPSWSATTML